MSLITKLQVLLWSSIFLFVFSPESMLINQIINVRVSDVISSIAVISFIFCSILGHEITLFKLKLNCISLFFICYLLFILILPLLGIILYNFPLSVYYGDFRWVQVTLLVWLLVSTYSNFDSFSNALDKFLNCGVFLQIPFLISQFLFNSGHPPNILLGLWYPGGMSELGSYGVHISRFSGSMSSASSLALFSGVAFLYYFMSVNFSKKNQLVSCLLGASSFIILLSSGSRTLIASLPMVLILFSFTQILLGKSIPKNIIKYWVVIGVLTILSIYIVISLDLGRLSSQGRLGSLYDLLNGSASFESVSGGRGGDRWLEPIIFSYDKYSFMGTLANPSHILDSYEVFDSYFVFLMIQGGLLFLVLFIFLLLSIIFKSLFGKQDVEQYLFPFSVAITIFIYAITSNVMTTLPARYLLVICVFVINLAYKSKPRAK